MTLIIGSIERVFVFTSSIPYITVESQTYWVGILFVSFSLLFAFLGYFSELNARDDLLTPLRKKLVGFWEVRSQSWRIEGGKIALSCVVSHCTIGIEQVSGKLLMHFDISNSDVFKDQSVDITATTFTYAGEPRKLIYFYEAQLQLKTPVGEGAEQTNKVEFPFLGVLRLVFDNEEINVMDGYWYDVDNVIYGLARRIKSLAGYQELAAAVEKGAVTFRGVLQFRRLKALPGMEKK